MRTVPPREALTGACLGCLLALALPAVVLAASDGRPNIVLVVADDLGAETMGAYGGESYPTPHLDALAEEGIRFDHAHSQPLGTPSRVVLLTGQHAFRHRDGETAPANTIANYLGAAGYRTAVAGKWVDEDSRFDGYRSVSPGEAGFDDFLVWHLGPGGRESRYWAPVLDHNGETTRHGEDAFGPDVIQGFVLQWIAARADEPFFLYYPMVLPHSPWVTTPDMTEEAADEQRRFAAMVAYMDTLLGEMIDALESSATARPTVVLFTSDNGTERDIVSTYRGAQMAGGKARTATLGTRVPLIAWGPGIVTGGGVSDSLVDQSDILPTVLELARIERPVGQSVDGMSLVPVLAGGAELSRDSLFVHYEPSWPTGRPTRYAFDRRWKFYEDGRFYDMQADPGERRPLARRGLDREAFTAYRALEARVADMPGELPEDGRWLPPLPIVLFLAALLFIGLVFRAGFRLLNRLDGEEIRK